MSLCVFDIAITIETQYRSRITFRITQRLVQQHGKMIHFICRVKIEFSLFISHFILTWSWFKETRSKNAEGDVPKNTFEFVLNDVHAQTCQNIV